MAWMINPFHGGKVHPWRVLVDDERVLVGLVYIAGRWSGAVDLKRSWGKYGCPALSLGWSPLCGLLSVSLCLRLTSFQGSNIVGLVSAMVQIMAG